MVGGSYFCGDHSCNTYKHVGEKFGAATHGSGPQTIYEQHPDGVVYRDGYVDRRSAFQYLEAHQLPSWTYQIPNTSQGVLGARSESGLYTDGSGNLHGGRDPHDSSLITNNPALVQSRWVQADQHGYPLRGDAALPQYSLYDGKRASGAAVFNATGVPVSLSVVHRHHSETLVAGACKAACDRDLSCKAFQENRWEALHTTIKCTTFHFDAWVHETTLVEHGLTDNDAWDFYAKYTQAKNPTWLHAPIHTAFSPTTNGGGSPNYAGYQGGAGRRLDGVY